MSDRLLYANPVAGNMTITLPRVSLPFSEIPPENGATVTNWNRWKYQNATVLSGTGNMPLYASGDFYAWNLGSNSANAVSIPSVDGVPFTNWGQATITLPNQTVAHLFNDGTNIYTILSPMTPALGNGWSLNTTNPCTVSNLASTGTISGNGGGMTNLSGLNIVQSYQFTNLLAFSSGSVHNTSFAAYYTNNTGSNADVYFTATSSTSGQASWAYYIFDPIPANAPFSGMTNTVPNSYAEVSLQTIKIEVRPGEWFSVSNTISTAWSGSTNRVVLHMP